ncbi:efflux RND transporter periplasmic adaptor subunit [Arenimonas composti]|uniref:RND efflux pump membrane fusion protein barrel-sandwich domain-containing protein n=1 Tax=Arenimonas composti TR7-09 = DSM 18010 TaxID=1121013 RepID=A0A091BJT2_9GAMM|nr:efflux RND transporter periplasmic adaptor subunit [Arenimonas composti]KFN51054.1 hypothetical protein P873_03920 [Arenimonas composti TR7-09 = DSM 18010]
MKTSRPLLIGTAAAAAFAVWFATAGGSVAARADAAAAPTAAPEAPPARVEVAPAVAAEFAPRHWAPGSVASRADARIAAETGGRVVFVAEVGSVLQAGDVIARLDETPLRLREREAEADLARLRAQLDYARRQQERYAALVRSGGISGAQLDQVAAERRMREQDVAAALVALEQAQLALRQAAVRTPFAGIVVERSVERGEFLAVGAPVARLVDTAALELRARAPVALAAGLREGVAVTVRDGERQLELPLATVVPVGDEASRQLELRVALPPSAVGEHGWVVGAALQLGVPSEAPRPVVAVPRDALLMRRDGDFVVRVTADGRGERLPVRTGLAENGLVEVDGGVQPGDMLVVRGGERLIEGQRVIP